MITKNKEYSGLSSVVTDLRVAEEQLRGMNPDSKHNQQDLYELQIRVESMRHKKQTLRLKHDQTVSTLHLKCTAVKGHVGSNLFSLLEQEVGTSVPVDSYLYDLLADMAETREDACLPEGDDRELFGYLSQVVQVLRTSSSQALTDNRLTEKAPARPVTSPPPPFTYEVQLGDVSSEDEMIEEIRAQHRNPYFADAQLIKEEPYAKRAEVMKKAVSRYKIKPEEDL